jgi:hypothetical protein
MKICAENVKKQLHVGGYRLASVQTDKRRNTSEGQFPGKSECSLLRFDSRAASVQQRGRGLHTRRYRKSITVGKFKLPHYSANHSKIAKLIVGNKGYIYSPAFGGSRMICLLNGMYISGGLIASVLLRDRILPIRFL